MRGSNLLALFIVVVILVSNSNAKYPFADVHLPISDRVQDLISRLTLDEKANQLHCDAPAIDRLNISFFRWGNEGIHGLLEYGDPGATIFPVPLALGATFDDKLVEDIAAIISDEGRAYDNREYNTTGSRRSINYWAPNINLFRDPRWGRGLEVYSEDPALMARMAVAYVKGLQGNHPNYTKANASPKHFAAYSLEGAEGYTRHNFDAQVSISQLEGIYFKAFKAAFQEGKAKSVMCSYNSVNGVPACANPLLLTSYLRAAWGFTGFVVSDCGAIGDIAGDHGYVKNWPEAAAAAIHAGCELQCDDVYKAVPEAVQQGLITMAELDEAVRRILTSRFELGAFDPPELIPWSTIGMDVVGSDAHVAKAREAAAKSFVLLKNEGGLLPLKADGLKKVGLTGWQIDWVSVVSGNYAGKPTRPVKTMRQVITDRLGDDRVWAWTLVDCMDGSGSENAGRSRDMGDQTDVLIVFAGNNAEGQQKDRMIKPYLEGEGVDRNSLLLPTAQDNLIRAAAKGKAPVVLVLMHGGPFDISAYKALPNIKAILVVWYPAMGSEAVGDVLFGDVSPSGRLPTTFYYENYTDVQPFTNMDMIKWPGRTYMYIQVPVVYEFGDGLSYSRFQYSQLRVRRQENAADPHATTFDFLLHNEGPMDADEVVLFFWSRDGVVRNDAEELPFKMLLDFQRVHLKVGESRGLTFRFGTPSLADTMLGATQLSDARQHHVNPFPATFHIGPLRYKVTDGLGRKGMTEAAAAAVTAQ